MESGLIFWEKYFKAQLEVTWDEFARAFSKLLLDYGKIQLDEEQLLFIKSLIDPDYRNVVKVSHFLIFQDTVPMHAQTFAVLEGAVQEASTLQASIQEARLRGAAATHERTDASRACHRQGLPERGTRSADHAHALDQD